MLGYYEIPKQFWIENRCVVIICSIYGRSARGYFVILKFVLWKLYLQVSI